MISELPNKLIEFQIGTDILKYFLIVRFWKLYVGGHALHVLTCTASAYCSVQPLGAVA